MIKRAGTSLMTPWEMSSPLMMSTPSSGKGSPRPSENQEDRRCPIYVKCWIIEPGSTILSHARLLFFQSFARL